MKKFVASAMAAAMAVSLAACGSTSTSTATSTAESKTESTAASSEAAAEETAGNLSGTLEVWSSGEELGRFVEGFNKEYPDVTVNITVVPNADFLTKLTPTLASGQGAPDIFTGESDYVKYLVNSGYWDDLNQEPYNVGQYKDLYAVHLKPNCCVACFNCVRFTPSLPMCTTCPTSTISTSNP